MTFNVVSDIHFQPTEEFTKSGVFTGNYTLCQIDFDFKLLKPADYLLIAGDLATDDIFEMALSKVKKDTSGKFKNIFYILGNHDRYDVSFTKTISRKNRVVEEQLGENIVLLGTTLWTPVPDIDKEAVVSRMNDFRAIPNWTIDEVRDAYNEQSAWLRSKVKHYKYLGKKVIVMTHHIPRVELHNEYEAHKRWFAKQKDNNPRHGEFWGYYASYYVTDGSCNDIKPDVWISGHHHTKPIDRVIDGVRYIRNTIGYSGEWYGWRSQLPDTNWYDFIVEV